MPAFEPSRVTATPATPAAEPPELDDPAAGAPELPPLLAVPGEPGAGLGVELPVVDAPPPGTGTVVVPGSKTGGGAGGAIRTGGGDGAGTGAGTGAVVGTVGAGTGGGATVTVAVGVDGTGTGAGTETVGVVTVTVGTVTVDTVGTWSACPSGTSRQAAANPPSAGIRASSRTNQSTCRRPPFETSATTTPERVRQLRRV
jgi:hypothetical protein